MSPESEEGRAKQVRDNNREPGRTSHALDSVPRSKWELEQQWPEGESVDPWHPP
jgi:hypothetical protein